MMSVNDIDNRNTAPIPDSAWRELDDVAREVLRYNCSARRFCSVDGPLGLDVAAVNTGSISSIDKDDPQLIWGVRDSRPLVEQRVPFALSLSQVLHVAHGARDIDWSRLEQAALRVATFEDRAIYYGLEEAGIAGIIDGLSIAPRSCDGSPEDLLAAMGAARCDLIEAGMGEEATLVVGNEGLRLLGGVHAASGRPLHAIAKEMIGGGEIIRSPAMKQALLLSPGPDRFELTIGQDISLRYISSDEDELSLGFLGTFTFRLLEDRAGVSISW